MFVNIGQDVHVTDDLTEAIHEGVRQGYTEGYLRKSVFVILWIGATAVIPPAMIYYDVVPGDKIEITVAPKGAGSENMSGIKMLKLLMVCKVSWTLSWR